jgi:hypothetical protein
MGHVVPPKIDEEDFLSIAGESLSCPKFLPAITSPSTAAMDKASIYLMNGFFSIHVSHLESRVVIIGVRAHGIPRHDWKISSYV